MKRLYRMHWEGYSARAIARERGLARNTVLKYLRSSEAMRSKPRPPRVTILNPYAQHIDRRWVEGLENCVVLLRALGLKAEQFATPRNDRNGGSVQVGEETYYTTGMTRWALLMILRSDIRGAS